jgi:hypothetical protein
MLQLDREEQSSLTETNQIWSKNLLFWSSYGTFIESTNIHIRFTVNFYFFVKYTSKLIAFLLYELETVNHRAFCRACFTASFYHKDKFSSGYFNIKRIHYTNRVRTSGPPFREGTVQTEMNRKWSSLGIVYSGSVYQCKSNDSSQNGT